MILHNINSNNWVQVDASLDVTLHLFKFFAVEKCATLVVLGITMKQFAYINMVLPERRNIRK